MSQGGVSPGSQRSHLQVPASGHRAGAGAGAAAGAQRGRQAPSWSPTAHRLPSSGVSAKTGSPGPSLPPGGQESWGRDGGST